MPAEPSVVLTCARVPVSTTVAEPLPDTAAPPADATVNVPCATPSVTEIDSEAASTSLTDRPAIDRFVPVIAVLAPGTVLTGASLTAARVRETVTVLPPTVPSLALYVKLSAPL